LDKNRVSIIIIATLGTSITGLYSVGYQIALVINVLVFSFNQAWIPYLNKTLANEPTIEDKEKIVKFTYLYFVLIFVVSIVFSYCMKKILPYFLGIKFMESFQFIPYFSISFAFTGMYYMVTNYIFYTQKTYLLSIVTLTVSMIHFCLLYVLTNLNGAIGAAQASLVSFFITFLITWYLASKVYKMPWKIWKTYD
jgi:O-antigen/teichoic acid export membrane protein